MKIVLALLTLVFLSGLRLSIACGDHDLKLLKAGTPLIHHNLNKKNMEKQFPDPNINYDPNNRSHRGMSPYLATSLKNTFKIALTYDDGPHPTRTPALLDILKKYDVKATFFAMGELIERYPKIAKRIVNEGHILASHDWRHDNSNSESEVTYRFGLKKSILKVKNYYAGNESYYRFPYGAYGRSNGYHHFNVIKEVSYSLFGENCINFAFWDIDTSDWVADMTAQNIYQTFYANIDGGTAYRFKSTSNGGTLRYVKEPYTINNPVKGGVVLMHDIHQRTVEATELILNEAMTRNIEFILLNNVDEFSYNGVQCNLI